MKSCAFHSALFRICRSSPFLSNIFSSSAPFFCIYLSVLKAKLAVQFVINYEEGAESCILHERDTHSEVGVESIARGVSTLLVMNTDHSWARARGERKWMGKRADAVSCEPEKRRIALLVCTALSRCLLFSQRITRCNEGRSISQVDHLLMSVVSPLRMSSWRCPFYSACTRLYVRLLYHLCCESG